MTQIELDPKLLAALQTLESHAVEYVLVGEVADAIHDGGGLISGIAIVPAPYGRNVDRLARALEALDARLAGGQPMDSRAIDLRTAAPCTFKTGQVDVELDFMPGGTKGYPDLFDDAARNALAPGVNPQVASPQDLERIDRLTRGAYGDAPPAALPTALQPEPSSWDADEAPPAGRPAALPPESADWGEIRASRATRR